MCQWTATNRPRSCVSGSSRAKLLQAVNINPAHFSGHSFHIGVVTTAAQADIEDSVVKMLGLWDSAAYQRYIRTPRDQLAAISTQLAHI